MSNIEADFKNYVLTNTQPQNREKMSQLLNTKFDQERNENLTPNDLIEFITSFYSLVKPEFRSCVDSIMDANGNIKAENHYLFDSEVVESQLLVS